MLVDLQPVLMLLPIACLGSFVYGVTGFGSALVTIPLASLLFPLPFVLAVFGLVDIANAVRAGFAEPRAIVRAEASRLLPSCLVGVGAGTLLLTGLQMEILLLALGLFVVGFALYSLVAPEGSLHISRRWAYLAGFSGGVTSAVFGAGGPPYVIYLSLRPYGTRELRATMAATSVVSVAGRVVAFAAAGLLSSPAVWRTALPLMPAILGALWLADRTQARLPRHVVLRAIRVLLIVAGTLLVRRALIAM